MGPEGRWQDVGPRRLRPVVRPPDEPAGQNYRHSPPLRATVVLGQFFGTPQFTYSLGDPSKPYLGYPVDPALQVGLDFRNGVIGARVALTTVEQNLRNPYTHNWFFGVQREIGLGVVAEFNYLGSSGRNLYNAYNINRYAGDLVDGSSLASTPAPSRSTW